MLHKLEAFRNFKAQSKRLVREQSFQAKKFIEKKEFHENKVIAEPEVKDVDIMAILQANSSEESFYKTGNKSKTRFRPRVQKRTKDQKVTFDYQGKIMNIRKGDPTVTDNAH